MNERIKAVQRMFWALLAASVIVGLLGVPVGDDAATMQALVELSSFEEKFDRPALERALLDRASAQGQVPLDELARAVAGKAAPKLSAAESAEPLRPRAGIALAKLEQIHALGREQSALEIGTPSAEALAVALGWRLARRDGAARHELLGVTLTNEPCKAEDLEREREVAAARAAVLAAQAEFDAAQKRHEGAERLYDLRRKWKAPWKAIARANEKRVEMLGAMETAEQQLKHEEKRHASLAQQAEARTGPKRKRREAAQQPVCLLALATLRELPSGENIELALPTPIERRTVRVPPLTGVEFPVTRAAGVWDELAGLSVEQAIAHLRERFTWHYRHVEVSGVKLGGMTVLQLAPLALLPFFFGLLRRSRGLSALYNPFDRPQVEHLSTVGLGAGPLNLLVLVALPFSACVLCAWSLLEIGRLPIIPVVSAMAVVGLGALSHTALKDLLDLRDAITRSHSNPPPAPSAS